jgi:hypothetical protein
MLDSSAATRFSILDNRRVRVLSVPVVSQMKPSMFLMRMHNGTGFLKMLNSEGVPPPTHTRLSLSVTSFVCHPSIKSQHQCQGTAPAVHHTMHPGDDAHPLQPASSSSFQRTTLVLIVFTGDAGDVAEDYMRFQYVHHGLLQDADPGLAGFMDALLQRCDGLCWDRCSPRRVERLDALVELLLAGVSAGWADDQSWQRTTALPAGWPPITRVVTITALPK